MTTRRPPARASTLVLLLVAVLSVGLAACGTEDPAGSAAPTPPDPDSAFDPVVSRELAEGYLGVAESDVTEAAMVRIVRRGDEQLAVTMDLRPGRLNLELDADGEDVYRVSRVVVETDDGEDLVVE